MRLSWGQVPCCSRCDKGGQCSHLVSAMSHRRSYHYVALLSRRGKEGCRTHHAAHTHPHRAHTHGRHCIQIPISTNDGGHAGLAKPVNSLGATGHRERRLEGQTKGRGAGLCGIGRWGMGSRSRTGGGGAAVTLCSHRPCHEVLWAVHGRVQTRATAQGCDRLAQHHAPLAAQDDLRVDARE